MRNVLLLVPLFIAAIQPASAQTPGRLTCPAGQLRQIRVSEILPKGSLAGFRAALAEHAQWYSRNGFPQDRFALSQVVYESGNRRKAGAGGIRVMTVHSPMSDVPREKQDESWKSFVAKYKENSRIVSTVTSCETISGATTARQSVRADRRTDG